MRRLFCYTLSARAIGATVSAGALHAQGWGFESLIAHHRFGNGPRKGTVFCLGPFHGIRTRKGAELRKREAFSSAAREERSDEAGRGRRQPHADIPHRPPLNWKRSSQGDRFCLGPAHGIRTRQHVRHKGRGQKMAKMSTVTNFVAAIFGFRWVNLALNQRFEAFASCFLISITEHVWSN